MFKVSGHKAIIKDLHKIVSNRFIFYNDGENDLLYSGTNEYGNRILGSIVLEDDENEFIRFLHILISDDQYYSFINKKISLLSILKENESFFIVDQLYNGDEKEINLVTFNELPEEYRPLENSFCPEFLVVPTFDYTLSLKGRESDVHLTKPNDLSDVNTKFSSFLESSLKLGENLNLKSSIFIEAPLAGSFLLKFKVNIESQDQFKLYNISKEKLNEFLNGFFNYVFHHLPDEDSDIFTSREKSSEKLDNIVDELSTLYDQGQLPNKEKIRDEIITVINNSVSNLSGINYSSSFNRIEFSNISRAGQSIPIGSIDDNYIPSIEQKLESLVELEEIITKDENPTKYSIQVYQFNTMTGKGSALVNYDDKMDKVSIHAKGLDNYENTVLTHSMDEGKIINVLGVGERTGDKLKKITINLEK